MPIDRSFRLGGMVAVGSFKREDLKSTFDVTDYKNKFSIEYTGILPDLFREGQGIITTGSLVNGRFIATEVFLIYLVDDIFYPFESPQPQGLENFCRLKAMAISSYHAPSHHTKTKPIQQKLLKV
jgi:hypothetical protein